ncbi:LytR/AlgR family response regulator transcription factor [Gemmatimonas sp.]|jgi:two-component system LytT family response regulator|uniref:LytR/AlgR family response regulator transcription factor n=1 Tax=Gemmatimonas sp. TaxID=1962908 RepID=UPI0037C1AB8C
MRVLVVDDEAPARGRLCRLLDHLSDRVPITTVLEAGDGEQAVACLAETAVDVVLLDIRMPRLDGFGVVAAMDEAMPLTIFCTAHDEHALAAFDARALDYLLKPVQPDRLLMALQRAQRLLAGGLAARRRGLRAVAAVVETEARYLPRLLVHDEHRAVLLPVERIDHVRAQRNYCDVHAGPNRYRVRRTLQSLARRLDPSKFLQLNRSDLVRMDAIREIQPWSHGDYRVVLHDGSTLSWSRRFRAAQQSQEFEGDDLGNEE